MPPSRQEKPAASAFLCVPQALSLQPRVSRASDPRSGFWLQLAGAAGCTLTAHDPPLSSQELQLPGGPPGSCGCAAATWSGGPSSAQVPFLRCEAPHC